MYGAWTAGTVHLPYTLLLLCTGLGPGQSQDKSRARNDFSSRLAVARRSQVKTDVLVGLAGEERQRLSSGV